MTILGNKQARLKINMLSVQDTHQILLLGKQGIGKSLVAKELASRLLECSIEELSTQCDYYFLDLNNDNNSIEQIHTLIDAIKCYPINSDKRVILIDNANLLSIASQNALLKSLEDKQTYNSFIFVSHKPMLPTIHSRMKVLQFYDLTDEELYLYYQAKCLSKQDEDMLRIVADGTIGIAELLLSDQKLFSYYKSFYEYFTKNATRGKDILSLFNVLAEKDTNSFFTQYKEQVPILSKFLHNIFYACFYNNLSGISLYSMDTSKLNENYTVPECLDIMQLALNHIELFEKGIYSKNDFFTFIRSLI